jgi:LPXTG-motif cell wall-anchored protein
MPRSKAKRRRYRSLPAKKKRKPSPKWFGWSILIVMGIGVLMIVLNYLGVIPGTGRQASNLYLFLGLGLIGVGFLMSTAWR